VATSLANAIVAAKSRAVRVTIDDTSVQSPNGTAITASVRVALGIRVSWARSSVVARVGNASNIGHTTSARKRRLLDRNVDGRSRTSSDTSLEGAFRNEVATSVS